MPPVGFEPTISAGERQTYALDREATGIGIYSNIKRKFHYQQQQGLELQFSYNPNCILIDHSKF